MANSNLELATVNSTVAHLKKMLLGQLRYTDAQSSHDAPGHYLAVDCEMVGIGYGGAQDSLARVSIVNFYGAVMLDTFVRQSEPVTDYRTQFSGVRRQDVESTSARTFSDVQNEVISLVNGRMLIGHTLDHDLAVLRLSHPRSLQHDVKDNPAWRRKYPGIRRHKLKNLVRDELGASIQGGEHDSATDARAAMALFRLHEKNAQPDIVPSTAAGSPQTVAINSGGIPDLRMQSVQRQSRGRIDYDDFEVNDYDYDDQPEEDYNDYNDDYSDGGYF